MTDNEKRAHDIATVLLPKALDAVSSKLFIRDELNIAQTNSEEIVDIYLQFYDEILAEIESR